MLVVMQNHATQEQIDRVVKTIEEMGYAARPMPGETRTTVGLVGNDGRVDGSRIEALPGVAEIIHVSKPYKQVSREWRDGEHDRHDRARRLVRRTRDRRSSPVRAPSSPRSRSSRRRSACATPAPPRFAAARSSRAAHRTRFRDWARRGLELLALARRETGLPIVTEALDEEGAHLVAEYADCIQIGARNMQNYSLLRAVGRINKPVLLKRGMAATITDLLMSAEYILAEGNGQVILCERGIRSFDTMTRNLFDLTAIPIVQRLSHLPMIADPSHGTGLRDKVIPMARAAVAAGADGVIVEVHPTPDRALSDGGQSLYPDQFARLVVELRAITSAIGRSLVPTPGTAGDTPACRNTHANPHCGSAAVSPSRRTISPRRCARPVRRRDDRPRRRGVGEGQDRARDVRADGDELAHRLERHRRAVTYVQERPNRSRFGSRSRRPTPSSPTARSSGSICRAARPGQVIKRSATDRSARPIDLTGQFLDSPRTKYDITAAPAEDRRRPCGARTACSCPRPASSAPFTKATVWVDDDDSLIREFEVTEVSGVTRHVHLTTVEPNAQVSKSLFAFSIPAGVKIVDQTKPE